MNPNDIWWVILLCGVGTFLIRLWPMRWQQKQGDQAMPVWLKGALQALGPAAIGALIVASLMPSVLAPAPWVPLLRVGVGILAIVIARWRVGGVALPTLAGVVMYGVCAWLTKTI